MRGSLGEFYMQPSSATSRQYLTHGVQSKRTVLPNPPCGLPHKDHHLPCMAPGVQIFFDSITRENLIQFRKRTEGKNGLQSGFRWKRADLRLWRGVGRSAKTVKWQENGKTDERERRGTSDRTEA